MSNTKTGSKYLATQNLDVSEIAKLLRTEIKDGVKAGELPTAKYSVRIERFAGGQSIDISVKDIPFRIRATAAEKAAEQGAPRWATPAARELEDKLEGMLQAYNRDDSDSQTDYFNVKFYGHVRLSPSAVDDEVLMPAPRTAEPAPSPVPVAAPAPVAAVEPVLADVIQLRAPKVSAETSPAVRNLADAIVILPVAFRLMVQEHARMQAALLTIAGYSIDPTLMPEAQIVAIQAIAKSSLPK